MHARRNAENVALKAFAAHATHIMAAGTYVSPLPVGRPLSNDAIVAAARSGTPLLPKSARDASIENLGSLRRTEAVVDLLRNGKQITIAAVGGSITTGHGAGSTRRKMGWSRQLFDLISKRWPAAGNSTHTYVNGAIAAVPPPYFYMVSVTRDSNPGACAPHLKDQRLRPVCAAVPPELHPAACRSFAH